MGHECERGGWGGRGRTLGEVRAEAEERELGGGFYVVVVVGGEGGNGRQVRGLFDFDGYLRVVQMRVGGLRVVCGGMLGAVLGRVCLWVRWWLGGMLLLWWLLAGEGIADGIVGVRAVRGRVCHYAGRAVAMGVVLGGGR